MSHSDLSLEAIEKRLRAKLTGCSAHHKKTITQIKTKKKELVHLEEQLLIDQGRVDVLTEVLESMGVNVDDI